MPILYRGMGYGLLEGGLQREVFITDSQKLGRNINMATKKPRALTRSTRQTGTSNMVRDRKINLIWINTSLS